MSSEGTTLFEAHGVALKVQTVGNAKKNYLAPTGRYTFHGAVDHLKVARLKRIQRRGAKTQRRKGRKNLAWFKNTQKRVSQGKQKPAHFQACFLYKCR
jgi:hypothetical protein